MLEPQPQFLGLKVLGLGDNVVDRYVHQKVMYPGGNALNFAVYAKLLGADASFTGTFGTDAGARHIRDVLAGLGIPTPHCQVVEGEGGHADVSLAGGNRVFLGSNKGGVAETHPPALDQAALWTMSQQRFVHTSCFSHIDNRLPELRRAVQLLGYDISTRWTDSARLEHVAGNVDVVTLSLGENGRDRAPALRDVLISRGCWSAIMTMGAEGALLWNAEVGLVHVPPRPVEVIDTLGAGDAFATAAILGFLSRGWIRGSPITVDALRATGRFAAEAAADVCRIDGAFGHGRPIL